MACWPYVVPNSYSYGCNMPPPVQHNVHSFHPQHVNYVPYQMSHQPPMYLPNPLAPAPSTHVHHHHMQYNTNQSYHLTTMQRDMSPNDLDSNTQCNINSLCHSTTTLQDLSPNDSADTFCESQLQCAECNQYKAGDSDSDGTFYCNQCWTTYLEGIQGIFKIIAIEELPGLLIVRKGDSLLLAKGTVDEFEFVTLDQLSEKFDDYKCWNHLLRSKRIFPDTSRISTMYSKLKLDESSASMQHSWDRLLSKLQNQILSHFKQLQMKILEREGNQQKNLCTICVAHKIDACFIPCGHQAVCWQCYSDQTEEFEICPICRKAVTNTVRTFMSGF